MTWTLDFDGRDIELTDSEAQRLIRHFDGAPMAFAEFTPESTGEEIRITSATFRIAQT